MRNWSDVGGIAARILACGGAVIDAAPVAGAQSASRAHTSEPVKPRSAIRLRSGTQRSDGRYRAAFTIFQLASGSERPFAFAALRRTSWRSTELTGIGRRA